MVFTKYFSLKNRSIFKNCGKNHLKTKPDDAKNWDIPKNMAFLLQRDVFLLQREVPVIPLLWGV